jgi:hypothetical protein
VSDPVGVSCGCQRNRADLLGVNSWQQDRWRSRGGRWSQAGPRPLGIEGDLLGVNSWRRGRAGRWGSSLSGGRLSEAFAADRVAGLIGCVALTARSCSPRLGSPVIRRQALSRASAFHVGGGGLLRPFAWVGRWRSLWRVA